MRWSFPIENNFKNQDLSYKADLDFWGCFGRENSEAFKINTENLDLSNKTDLDFLDCFGMENRLLLITKGIQCDILFPDAQATQACRHTAI